jgi:hypothetical protein
MRLSLSAALLALLAGCATPVSVPQAPAVSSPAGQQCVEECQTAYARCEQPCGVGSSARRVPACQEQCYEELAGCYARCEQL